MDNKLRSINRDSTHRAGTPPATRFRTAIALFFGLVLLAARPAAAAPVLGGQLYATGGDVMVEVLPATAGLVSELHLYSPGPDRFIALNTSVGTVVNIGSFPAGTELVFGIFVRGPGDTFKMGPASRNPDNIVHAAVDSTGPGMAIVGFEDLLNGGDRDYDDNVFKFTGGIAPLACPGDITAAADMGACSAAVTYTATPPDGATLACSPISGSVFPLGMTTVNCTATYLDGRTAMCIFKVTVEDREAPTAQCPQNIVQANDAGKCSAVVNYSATACDNCAGPVVAVYRGFSQAGGGAPYSDLAGAFLAPGVSFATDFGFNWHPFGLADFGADITGCLRVAADGTYTFTLNADDGALLFIDGVLVVDDGGVHPPVAGSGSAVLTAGIHTFEVQFFECCAGPSGVDLVLPAGVTYAGGEVPVICNPPSGSDFSLGTTTVNCKATDGATNTTECRFTVTVRDTEAPKLTCGNLVAANAPGQCSAVVRTYDVRASDNCTAVTVVCTPPAGSTFPQGPTTVNCTATDGSTNSASCSFTVTVNDTEAPNLTCGNIVVSNDRGLCSAVIGVYDLRASDNCTAVTVVCTPPAGSTFPKGATTVNCTATDGSTNSASCRFTVTVNDTERPSITCPTNLSAASSSPSESEHTGSSSSSQPGALPAGSVVTFSATAADNCTTVTLVCVPPSGTAFPLGVTTVNCTATDGSGNTNSCSFTVTATPRAAKAQVRNELVALLATVTNSSDRMKIQTAISELNESLRSNSWLDGSHPRPGSPGEDVFANEKEAILPLKALRTSNRSGIAAATVQGFINRILAVDRALAVTAINEAIARGGKASKISSAQSSLSKGATDAAADKPDKAIDDYKAAWKTALSA